MAGRSEAILVFPSTHHMLRAEALLKEGGFAVRLVPAPPQAGELCTTAIAVPASAGEEAAGLLEERGVLVKALLYPEAVPSLPGSLPAELASRLSAHPVLLKFMEIISRGETPARPEVEALLELEDEEPICRAAEALAGTLVGREAVPAVVLDLSGGGPRRGDDGARGGRYAAPGIEELSVFGEEMRSRGVAYLVLSLGEGGELPWSAEEFREALGGNVVVVVYAGRVPWRPGELVRKYGVRQILLRRDDLFRMGPGELADEIFFLRDNRPGPVGSGNLVPLLSGEMGGGEGARRRVRTALAVLRLVLGKAFLPVPEDLWRQGRLCGGNFLLLESAPAKEVGRLLEEAESALAPLGWSVRKVRPFGKERRRRPGRKKAPVGLGGSKMLIDRIEIEQVEPCFADETKIRLIARIPVDVRDLLPYLNAVLANATYVGERDDAGEKEKEAEPAAYAGDRPALTFTRGPRLVTVYPRRVTIAKADDVADAEEVLAWLAERLNYVHEHREEIEPVTEGKIKIKPLDIYGLLPQTNCRECGEQGCLAFALLLLQEKHRPRDCPPLYREERWRGKRKRLEEVVASLGLPV